MKLRPFFPSGLLLACAGLHHHLVREGTRLREYACAENNLDPGRYEELLKNGAKVERK